MSKPIAKSNHNLNSTELINLTSQLIKNLKRDFSHQPTLIEIANTLKITEHELINGDDNNPADYNYKIKIVLDKCVIQYQDKQLRNRTHCIMWELSCVPYQTTKFNGFILASSELEKCYTHLWGKLAEVLGNDSKKIPFADLIRFVSQLCFPKYDGDWKLNPLAYAVGLEKLIKKTPGLRSTEVRNYGVFSEVIEDRTLKNIPRFWQAIKDNEPHLVRKFCAFGYIDPAIENNKPLFTAVELNLVEIVIALAEDSRVDPSADNNKAYKMAKAKNYKMIVWELLRDSRVKKLLNS